MQAKTNLKELIQSMSPKLHEGTYVFVSVPSIAGIPQDKLIAQFREEEGITLILSQGDADQFNLAYDYVAAWITLQVHSALEAVGLTAAFASELAEHNISCNVVAGYFHDHIFVAEADGLRALIVLEAMRKKA